MPEQDLGIGQRNSELSMEDARELAAEWGKDPVHPTRVAYKKIAAGILKDIGNGDLRYTNPPRSATQQPKKPRLDLSLERDIWARGCTAALPRRDTAHSTDRGDRLHLGASAPRGANRRGHGARGHPSSGGSSELVGASRSPKCSRPKLYNFFLSLFLY